MAATSETASRIWNLCHVLRDDGIVYHKYLSELTYLLFLKNAKQLGIEGQLPEGCRWDDLLAHLGPGMLGYYRKLLTQLGEDVRDEIIRHIFSFPTTVFSHDENLRKVVLGIESIDWHSAKSDRLGDIYESLLERNATESRSGAGQYFTPRALVDCMVQLTAPAAGELIQDPAAGTGGFLISAHHYISRSSTRTQAAKTRYQGIEIERDTYRLCLMNMYLHEMTGKVVHGDALTSDSSDLQAADLILANPPFGISAGGARVRRSDLPFATANKQLMFLQHIYLSLKPGGRAAVVVPDNVLFEPGVGKRVREDLMSRCELHTLLRLPAGIFYAAGVKTNVLFFSRSTKREGRKGATWVYDMRTNAPTYSKTRPLQAADFQDFITAFGSSSLGLSRRRPTTNDRFRKFSHEEISNNNYDLNIQWMDDAQDNPEAVTAQELLSTMAQQLRFAGTQLGELAELVTGTPLTENADE